MPIRPSHGRVPFVPNRVLAAVGIAAAGSVLGTSAHAEILKCVNDAGKVAFANTGECPAGYRLSETSSESRTAGPAAAVTTGRRRAPAAVRDEPAPVLDENGDKVPSIWEIGFGDPAAQKWLEKKLTDKSKWTAEGRASTPEKVWSQMKAALIRGDTEGALRCFHPLSRGTFERGFRAMGADARVMAQQMKELIPREKNDFGAAYWLPRDVEIGGSVKPLVFSVTFVRGLDGVWLIDQF